MKRKLWFDSEGEPLSNVVHHHQGRSRKRKPAIWFDGDGEPWLFVAKHRCYLPWKFSDAVHTPQWKAFVADACAKPPTKRTKDERRAIAFEIQKCSE